MTLRPEMGWRPVTSKFWRKEDSWENVTADEPVVSLVATAGSDTTDQRELIVLADDELALHPWVDQAHEVMRRALLRGHVEVLGGALLGLNEGAIVR